MTTVRDCKFLSLQTTDVILRNIVIDCIFSPHHTTSAPVLYAFREALAEIIDEGIDLMKLRHAENAHRLREGLTNIGLELFVENPEQRLPSITSIRIPHGVNIDNVIKCMMDRCVLTYFT